MLLSLTHQTPPQKKKTSGSMKTHKPCDVPSPALKRPRDSHSNLAGWRSPLWHPVTHPAPLGFGTSRYTRELPTNCACRRLTPTGGPGILEGAKATAWTFCLNSSCRPCLYCTRGILNRIQTKHDRIHEPGWGHVTHTSQRS